MSTTPNLLSVSGGKDSTGLSEETLKRIKEIQSRPRLPITKIVQNIYRNKRTGEQMITPDTWAHIDWEYIGQDIQIQRF